MKTHFVSWLEGPLWAVGATLALWAALAIVLGIFKKRNHNKGLSPQERQSVSAARLKEQIDHGGLKARAALASVIATPILFGLSYAAFAFTAHAAVPAEGVAVAGILCLAMWGWACLKWRAAARDLNQMQWIFDAKALVAKHIHDLKERGCLIFNDCRLGDSVIDHILIGPKGVFTVKTFVASSAYQADLNTYGTVTYDGRALFFPGKEDHESVERACAEAERLSDWLSEALDIPLAARAIVALPGWQVKRTSAEGISVINPTQFEALFQYVRPRPLTTDAVALIAEQVRQHCMQSSTPVNTTAPYGATADLKDGG